MLDQPISNDNEPAPERASNAEGNDIDELARAKACNDALVKALVGVIGKLAEVEARATAGEEDGEDEVLTSGPEPAPEVPPTVCLAGIPAAEVPWLWRGRIPCGRLTFLQGPKGTGKSFLALDIAARVTRGAPWPDAPDQAGTPGSVLLVTAQDHLAETIIPRLISAGADLTKVHALQTGLAHRGEPRAFHISMTERLEQAMAAHPDLKLVVIDPVNAFVGFSNDRRFNTFTNRLRAIAKLAERYGVAVLLVNATDPGSNGRTWQFGADILPELKEASRAVWSLSEDPLNPSNRLFLPVRTNLAAEPAGLRFVIDRERGVLAWSDEPLALRGGDVPRAERSRSASDVAKAAAWLQPILAEGAQSAETVLREGAAAGHSRQALYAAKARLGVKSSKGTGTFAGGWTWELGQDQDRNGRSPFEVRRFGAPASQSEAGGFEDSKILAPGETGNGGRAPLRTLSSSPCGCQARAPSCEE